MRVKTSISLVIGDDPELVLTAEEARRIYSALKDIFDPPHQSMNLNPSKIYMDALRAPKIQV